MSNIVQKSREPNQTSMPRYPSVLITELTFQRLSAALHNAIVQGCCHMHHAEGMLEPCVHRGRIDLISPCKLSDPSKPLERRLRNDIALPIIESNKPIDRATNFQHEHPAFA